MNGYDFDDTIFKGNSYRRFYFFCLLRLPYIIIYFPIQAIAWLLWLFRIIDRHRFLNVLERFIVFVPNKQKFVNKFWDKNICRVKNWYLDQKRYDDVIVSASPQYLVEEACRRLGVKCIASDVDMKTGKIKIKHCHDVFKIFYFYKAYGCAPLAAYYSDSMSDSPMFKWAQKGFFVKGDKITLVYEDGRETK